MLPPFKYRCPVCGQAVDSAADPYQGERQRYVEDCQVCCRPLVIDLRIQGGTVVVDAAAEAE